MTIEQDIALAANFPALDSIFGEGAIEVARTAAVKRVAGERIFRLPQNVEADEFFEPGEVGATEIDKFEFCFVVVRGRVHRSEFCGAPFDIFRDFRKRGSAIGPGKFHAVVFRRIVARGDVDRAVGFAALNFVSDRGRRGGMPAKENAAAAIAQDLSRGPRKFFGEKSSVVADEKYRRFVQAVNVIGNGCGSQADTGKIEFFGDNCSPTRGPEMDRVARHRRVLYLDERVSGGD